MSAIGHTTTLLIKHYSKQLGYSCIIKNKNLVTVSSGKKTINITNGHFNLNPKAGIVNAENKRKTHSILSSSNIPTIKQAQVYSVNDYKNIFLSIPTPQVIKPTLGQKGENIFFNITNANQGINAVQSILKKHKSAVVEEFFKGQDLRICVLNDQIIGVSQRHPPTIIGDGVHTIEELIDSENKNREPLTNKLGTRKIWKISKQAAFNYLNSLNIAPNRIIPNGQNQKLSAIANLAKGGHSENIAISSLLPKVKNESILATKMVGLNLSGIDLLTHQDKHVFLEINSSPGINIHDFPHRGKPQHAMKKIITHLLKPSTQTYT